MRTVHWLLLALALAVSASCGGAERRPPDHSELRDRAERARQDLDRRAAPRRD